MNRVAKPSTMLFMLTGLNLFNYLDRYVLSAVLTPMKKDLGLSDGSLGRIFTAFMVGYFVTSPFFGYLGDRVARKWLIAAGVVVWSAGTVLTGTASTLLILLSYRVLVGFGEASYATISPAVISDLYPASKRNNALTIFYAAIPVGAALGFIVGAQIAAHYGWRHAFIWAGVPGFILAIALLPFKEVPRGQVDASADANLPSGSDTSEATHKLPSGRDVFKLFRMPDYLLVVGGYVAYTFAIGAYAYWGPSFLERAHGLSNEFAGTFFGGISALAGLLGTLVGGFAATKMQKKNPASYAYLSAFAVLAAVPLIFLAFYAPGKVTAMVSLSIGTFLLFLPTGPVNTMIIESVPVNLRASGMAMSIFAIHILGDMWSPEIVGHLSDRWHSLVKALSILPIAFFVGGLIWLYMARRIVRKSKAPVYSRPTLVPAS